MRAYINLKNWTWGHGHYPMEKTEADEVMPVLEKNQPLPKNSPEGMGRYFCKDCGGEVDAIDSFCKWCGRRFA